MSNGSGKIIAIAGSVLGKIAPSAIQNEVDEWLGEHITNPNSPPLDRSLSLPSGAAPADMVGNLKSAINEEVGMMQNRLGYYNYFVDANVTMIDVRGDSTMRPGCDCGTVPAGTYILSYKQKPDTSNTICITKEVSGSYTDIVPTGSPYSFTLSSDTHIMVRGNGQTLSTWNFYEVEVIKSDARDVLKELDTVNSALSIFDEYTGTVGKLENIGISAASQKIVNGTGNCCIYFVAEPNTTYRINRTIIAARFVVATTASIPVSNEPTTQIVRNDSASSLEITTKSTDHYIVAMVYVSSLDTGYTWDQIYNDISVFSGSAYDREARKLSETANEKADSIYPTITKETLNIMSGLDISGDPIDLSAIETTGSFISYNGVVAQSDNYAYTSPISVKKGQKVILFGKGYSTSVAMISTYADSSYTPKVVSYDSTLKIYEWKATEDCQVVLSYNIATNHIAAITGKIQLAIDNYVYKELSFAGAIWGKFIGTDGIPASGANDFRYTPPISIKAGFTVVLKAAGYSTSVSMISKYNGENENYTPLVISTDSNVNEYTYHAYEDIQVALSYNNTKDHTAYCYIDVRPVNVDAIDYSVIFPKVSVIGDSLSSGCLYIGGTGTDYYGDSWLTYLARRCGLKRNHYSQGGFTAKDWLDSAYVTKLQNDEASNLYFIALGTNDNWFHPYEAGTAEDEAGTNTFAGYYKQIINTIRTKAPNAAIICLSLYKENGTYNPLIKAITDLYSKVYFIDVPANSEINPDTGGVWSAGSHFTTLGYKYIANVIYNQLNKIVEGNMADFKFYGQYNSEGEQYDFGS